jgi:hypothetical protein
MRAWGSAAGRIGGVGILIGIAASGLAAAVLGIGLLWLAVNWFTGVVLR